MKYTIAPLVVALGRDLAAFKNHLNPISKDPDMACVIASFDVQPEWCRGKPYSACATGFIARSFGLYPSP